MIKGKRAGAVAAGRQTAAVGRRKAGGGTEAPAEPVKRPRQQRIPGTEDAKIDALEDAAQDYAAKRDQRMQLTIQESDLKMTLLRLMKENKKETYQRDGVEINIVHEEETVRVRIGKSELIKELFDE
jgi:hypothetical protein